MNHAPANGWAAVVGASAHVPQTFRVPQTDSTAPPNSRPTHVPTHAYRQRSLSPNSIAINAALASGTLVSTRVRAEPKPHGGRKRKDTFPSRTTPEGSRPTGARPRPGTTAILPTTGANNPSSTKKSVPPSSTHHVTFTSGTKPRAPANRTWFPGLTLPPTIRPQHQTAKPNVTADVQLTAPSFHNIYPLNTFLQRSQQPLPPRHAHNEKSATTKLERRKHTQQLAQPTQTTLCNNGICKAPICNCNIPSGGWGKPKHTLPPPVPPPPPTSSLPQSVRLIVTMPLDPPSTFYLQQSLPASTHEIIRAIWRNCPGQFLRVLERITFTSSDPPPNGFSPSPDALSNDHPHCITIKPRTPAADKPLALNPLATHFVLVELGPPPSTSTTNQQTTETAPPKSPVYSEPPPSPTPPTPTYSPPQTPELQPTKPTPELQPAPMQLIQHPTHTEPMQLDQHLTPTEPTQLDPQTPEVQPTEPTPEVQPAPTQPVQHPTLTEPMQLDQHLTSTEPTQLDPHPTSTDPMDTSTPTDPPDELAKNAEGIIYTDDDLYDYVKDEAPAPSTPEPTATDSTPSALPEQPSIPLPTQSSPNEPISPYLASEPTAPSSQSPPPPIRTETTLCLTDYIPPPPRWSTISLLVPRKHGTAVLLHWANGIRTLTSTQPVLASSGDHEPPQPATNRPLPFYKPPLLQTATNRPLPRAPTPPPRRPNSSKHDKRTTTTPQSDHRTHPYRHYTTRTSSKSQHIPPELPKYRMILTNWAYALVALFHCSLPPYVLPDCIKWLLTTTKTNQGFRLSANALLSSAPALIAQHDELSANSNSTWDLPTPEPFMKLARAYLAKIGEAPTDATRHAIISQEPVIEQWLSVGLYLYPIETIAQQLWTVAYSYALRILTLHPGTHLHANHPCTSLDVRDDDYATTHPFTVKFNFTLHPIPITYPRSGATTPSKFEGLTTSALFRRFRNLMRLRGILCSVLFIVRTHLSAIRRRAYTDRFTDALRNPLQALPSISTAITFTRLPFSSHYTLIQLFTSYPAPYRNPIDTTTPNSTPTPPSHIRQGDPLTHLLLNTYHFDHRQFTIPPQQYFSAHITALYATLLQLPYLPPTEPPPSIQLPHLRSTNFSSDDLPLQNHRTINRSPPLSQATTEETSASEEEDQLLHPPSWESDPPP